jgi:hypothetical protein
MTLTTPAISRPKPAPRYDALAEFNRPVSAPLDARKAGRTFMGLTLLASGLAACVWLIYLIHAAIFRPDKLGILLKLLPTTPEGFVMTVPAGKVELPANVMTAVAYVLLILLLAIVAKIATALIREGSWLVRYDRLADAAPESPAHDHARDNPAPPAL